MTFRQLAMLAGLLALAIGSWWIVKPPLTASAPAPEIERTPGGYYLQGAVVRQAAADGRILYELNAERIQHHMDSDRAEMNSVRLDYFAPDIEPWILTADRGEVPDLSGTIRFSGNVVIAGQTDSSGIETLITTESLEVSTQEHIAATKDRVNVQHGRHSVSANGLRVDLMQEKLELESNVRGSFHP